MLFVTRNLIYIRIFVHIYIIHMYNLCIHTIIVNKMFLLKKRTKKISYIFLNGNDYYINIIDQMIVC